ncbi:MAG: oligopeptide ABC transporter ATP-binding protein [Thermoprotei archaeon]|nr:MAG: oligopeptide ABC transporter ATP-binding protein [Thermoprotei archaeon]
MKPFIEVKNLTKFFPVKALFFTKGWVRAVDNVSFTIFKGETFGLVGESGCGKTTLGRLLIRLIEPTSGTVYFDGVNIYSLKGKDLREFRKRAQIVFQDPYSSLNPRMVVFDIIAEAIEATHAKIPINIEDHIVSLLEQVGLSKEHLYRYPHEFSGGQRQRIAIARALAVNPEFIVLDEPTSALDVSVQAQILNLLKDLQKKYGFTYLFISHDLAVVKYMSHRIAVMYLGKIVELARSEELFERPLHPYTQILLSAIPIPDPKIVRTRKRLKPKGEPPSPINPPTGCRFHPRCPYAMTKCRVSEPPLVEIERDHYVACWKYVKG